VDGWNYNFVFTFNEIGWEDVNWTRLAWDRVRCWPVVNEVVNLRVPCEMRISGLIEELVAFQGRCFTELN
jgi:hypothetical protein